MTDNKDEAWATAKEGMKKTMTRFVLAHNDITASLYAWCRFVSMTSDTPPDVLTLQMALTACVASYGRAFCSDVEPLKRKQPWVLPEEVPLHEYLMALRHEMVAHSDRRRRFVRILPPGVFENGREMRVALRHLEFDPPCATHEVEARLRRLQSVLDKKSSAAVDCLFEHCKDQPEIKDETPLDDY